jgi:hypothetical protein
MRLLHSRVTFLHLGAAYEPMMPQCSSGNGVEVDGKHKAQCGQGVV